MEDKLTLMNDQLQDVIRRLYALNILDGKTIPEVPVEYATPEDIDPNAIELEPAIVKPEPVQGILNTWYPVGSPDYFFSGHSELVLDDGKNKTYITKHGDDYDYDLINNNCSTATRNALSQAFRVPIGNIPFSANPWNAFGNFTSRIMDTPWEVERSVAELGYPSVKVGEGHWQQRFPIAFATAMDLKNQEIDKQIKAKEHAFKNATKGTLTWLPAFKEIKSKHDASIAELLSQKYVFQPFKEKNGGTIPYLEMFNYKFKK